MTHPTPSTEIFEEIREAARKTWSKYDDEYGYRSGKLEIINRVTNLEDNVMVCYRMFDVSNQYEMRSYLTPDALEYIDANL